MYDKNIFKCNLAKDHFLVNEYRAEKKKNE